MISDKTKVALNIAQSVSILAAVIGATWTVSVKLSSIDATLKKLDTQAITAADWNAMLYLFYTGNPNVTFKLPTAREIRDFHEMKEP